MNKTLRYSLVALFAFISSLSFADAYKVLTFPDGNSGKISAYTETWTVTLDDFTWTISNFNNNNNGWNYIKCGRKSVESVAYIDTDTQMDQAIGSVVVTIDAMTASKINSISLTVASDKEFSNVVETVNAETLEAGDMTFNVASPAANYYYRLTFDCQAGSANGLVQVSKVSYYKDGDAPVIVDISNTPETAYTVAKANELITAGEGLATAVYVKGKISKIDNVDTSYGNATYYISDDGTEAGQLMVYRGYSLKGEKFTSTSEIQVGDEVIVYGTLVNYNNTTYQVATGSSIYSLNGETTGGNEGVDISNTPETAYTVAKANELITAGDGLATAVYVKGIISKIDEVDTSYGNATYYISDDGTETGQLMVYRGYSLEGAKFTSEDEIQVGDEVVIYGKLINYNGTYEVGTGSTIYSLNREQGGGETNVAAPVFSLEAGVYTTEQTLTLTAEEGCTIYYTTDGEAPTAESTKYEAPITLNKTTTVKAIAVNGEDVSNVASATYTFPVECENIAALSALESGTYVSLTLTDAQVVYVNAYTSGSNTNTDLFVRDASGAVDLYNIGIEIKANQMINGKLIAKWSPYNGLPELVKVDETSGDALTLTDGEEAQPRTVTVGDLEAGKYMADLVKVEDVHFVSYTSGEYTNWYVCDKDDENEVMVYDKFKIGFEFPAADDSKSYTLVGIMGSASLSGKLTNEIFPTAALTEYVDGISSVVKDAAAADGVIYNMAGQRLTKPAKGINIIGGKKVVVK